MSSTQQILPKTHVTGMTADSRAVEPGYLFAALKGIKADGHDFIPQAIEKGARALLVDETSTLPDDIPADIEIIKDPNPRNRLAVMCSRYYRPMPDTIVGITGTNGKTSIASFTRQIWAMMGPESASIGTIGVEHQRMDLPVAQKIEDSLTTPDPVSLHLALKGLKKRSINNVALEASSHGLDMSRLDGVRFMAAAFTNLSRDHLDYHGDMESYFEAKFRLFSELLGTGMSMVVHVDVPHMDRFEALAKERNLRLVTYGLDRGDIHLTSMTPWHGGYSVDIKIFDERFSVTVALPGDFQLENMLCALCLVMGCGEKPERIVPFLSRLAPVRGRLEMVGSHPKGAHVYVDYAHTPDALETLLSALNRHAKRKLHIVVGAGGDRDPGKRHMMGEVCAKYADYVYVTDDNPRSEDPAAIREAVMKGCPTARNIAGRKEAIFEAANALEAGDILVVAGKGHEQGQDINGTILPFDDVSVVNKAIEVLMKGGQDHA